MDSDKDEEPIRELAYSLWKVRGRREGHAEEDWLDAKRHIAGLRPATSVAQSPVTTRSPIQPMDDITAAETPKIGSRDAPGG